jgi:hypothetical protein
MSDMSDRRLGSIPMSGIGKTMDGFIKRLSWKSGENARDESCDLTAARVSS